MRRSAVLISGTAICTFFVLLVPLLCLADTDLEIRHLLEYVEKSDCTFIRNGKTYGGGRAEQHIRKKYDYVRSRVKSAEDFIELAATKSSMTGDPYEVRCTGGTSYTADWLKAELDRFRQNE